METPKNFIVIEIIICAKFNIMPLSRQQEVPPHQGIVEI